MRKIKIVRGTKEYVIKQKVKFEDYKHCLELIQLKIKSNNQKKIKLMQIVLEKFMSSSSKEISIKIAAKI